ncbi:HAMP domain-containing sensor histidine kinase [Paraburkholderia fungorum]|uniref:sensor histidine kinase n=1 Tax=Paraburkholderia fungorum TaxID=134537 RepID=UPI0038BD5B1C
MSDHPSLFRWSIGSPAARCVHVADGVAQRPQGGFGSLSNYSSAACYRFDALRRKDEILAMVAHELRGPLTPIQLASHFIRRASADRPEVLRSVDMIDRQLSQITRLADDLMDATRVGHGALRTNMVSIDVADFLAAPLAAAALAAAERAQTLDVQIADSTLRVEGDPVRLAQAVNNLLHNAVKYTPEHGRIAVNVLADREVLIVSVKDTGLGISDALLPHVFDLFAQSSRTISASAGGLGIGLAVVKVVAESHGGTVSAVSAGPGAGSEFTLRLPIVVEQSVTEALA